MIVCLLTRPQLDWVYSGPLCLSSPLCFVLAYCESRLFLSRRVCLCFVCFSLPLTVFPLSLDSPSLTVFNSSLPPSPDLITQRVSGYQSEIKYKCSPRLQADRDRTGSTPDPGGIFRLCHWSMLSQTCSRVSLQMIIWILDGDASPPLDWGVLRASLSSLWHWVIVGVLKRVLIMTVSDTEGKKDREPPQYPTYRQTWWKEDCVSWQVTKERGKL